VSAEIGLFDVRPAPGVCCAPGTGIGGACFSADRRMRYALWRRWATGPIVAFVMLNPSAADERELDRTVARCIAFARAWRYGALIVVNISPLVATNRHLMYAADDRAGEGIELLHIR
jgi:hypothetical protein